MQSVYTSPSLSASNVVIDPDFKKTFLTAGNNFLCSELIENLEAEILLENAFDQSICVLVPNQDKRGNSYIASITSQYILYAFDELKDKKNTVQKWLIRQSSALLDFVMRKLNFNNILIIDFQFLATHFPTFPNPNQYHNIVLKLNKKFRNKAPIIKGFNQIQHETEIQVFKSLGYEVLFNRKIYLREPDSYSGKQKRPLEQDLKRWEKQSTYYWRKIDIDDTQELKRCIELYREVYIEKHNALNPQYSIEFLRSAINSNFLQGEVMCDNYHRVVGVQLYYIRNKTITTPFIGYKTSLPKTERLYPFLNCRLYSKAKENGYTFNMSSGSGNFKTQRGGIGTAEYIVIYTQHLGAFQQKVWRLFAQIVNKYAQPMIMRENY